MLREIGSDFWDNIEHDNRSGFRVEGIHSCQWKQFYISGRSAIRAFARNVKVEYKRVLIPAFSCETVIVPFEKEGWEIAYYGICTNLSPNKQHLIECIECFHPSVVFVQSYFGFNTIGDFRDIIELCKKKGIVVIEDLTQCLFSDFKKTEAQYYVSSFRKFIAIPEGGVLLSQDDSVDGEIGEAIPGIVEIAKEAFGLKKKYMDGDVNISKEEFLEKYRNLKGYISEYSDVYKMNALSKEIFFHIDIQMLQQRRRENYKFLYETCKAISWMVPVLGMPNQMETPLYFPVYMLCADKRKKIQEYFASKNIYCPIVWPRYVERDKIDNDSIYIYEHILCIPCDQRYSTEEMYYITEVAKGI